MVTKKRHKYPIRICNDCGKPIKLLEMYVLNIPKLKVLYWHTECYDNFEKHIRKNETYDEFVERTTTSNH